METYNYIYIYIYIYSKRKYILHNLINIDYNDGCAEASDLAQ